MRAIRPKVLIFTGACVLITGLMVHWRHQGDTRVMPVAEQLDIQSAKSSHLVARVHTPATSQQSSPGIHFYTKMEDAPEWTVPYGEEFWIQAGNVIAGSKRIQHAGFDISRIIERVSRTISKPDANAHPEARNRGFTALFTGAGFEMTINRVKAMVSDNPEDTQSGSTSSANTRVKLGTEPDPLNHLNFKTTSITIGEVVAHSGDYSTVPWSILGNTAQAFLKENLLEHYENRSEGVEVTWVLKNKPIGEGPLTITAELGGATFSNADEKGYHFMNLAGMPFIKMGGIEVVDATGWRARLPASIEGSRVIIEVPESILKGAAYPVAIDPTIGPELVLGACMELNPQYLASVGWNGSNYLVSWNDERRGHQDLYAARVTTTGYVLDPTGIAITTNLTSGENLSQISSDGTNYFIVWTDARNSAWASADIYGARVNKSGVLLDTNSVLISSALGNQGRPDVGWNGTNYLVAWEDDRAFQSGTADIYAARVSPSGAVLETNGIVVAQRSTLENRPRVASNGKDYLVVWEDYTNGLYASPWVYGARVDSGGVVLDSGIVLHTNAYSPQIAYSASATNYLTSFFTTNGVSGVYGTRLKVTAGTLSLVDGTGFMINTNHGGQELSLASNGTNYLCVWAYTSASLSDKDVYGARVRALDGAVLDTNNIVVCNFSGEQYRPQVTSDGANFLAVWSDGTSTNYSNANDVFAARINNSGVVLDWIPVSTSVSATNQTAPAVAHGADWLVVWTDSRGYSSNGFDIYGTRVDDSGRVRDICGIAIGVGTNHQNTPGVGWDGNNYLVTWSDGRTTSSSRNIYGARVDTSGVVLDTSPIMITTNSANKVNSRVAGNSNCFLVVWEDNSRAYGCRVSSAGSLLDAVQGFPVCTNAAFQFNPEVASIGTNFFVVWQDRRLGSTLYGSRVSGSGQVLDGTGFALCSSTNVNGHPGLAASATNYFAVWEDIGSSSTYVYGARVSANGILLDTNSIAISTNGASARNDPDAACIGSDFVVVWRIPSGTASGIDVRGARVQGDGVNLDPAGFDVMTSPGSNLTPAISAGNNSYLIISATSVGTGNSPTRGVVLSP